MRTSSIPTATAGRRAKKSQAYAQKMKWLRGLTAEPLFLITSQTDKPKVLAQAFSLPASSLASSAPPSPSASLLLYLYPCPNQGKRLGQDLCNHPAPKPDPTVPFLS